jgi:ornithine cyclodeaminase
MKEGLLMKQSIRGDLAGLIAGTVAGRSSQSEVTVFKAVGLAFEDNAVAWSIYRRALDSGTGGWVEI